MHLENFGIRLLVIICCLFLPLFAKTQHLTVSDVKCENRADPIAIESSSPRLNWILKSDERNVLQTAYQIIVSDDTALIAKNEGNVWDSKKINSDASIMVAYHGAHLKAANTYYWKVKVWDNHSNVSSWSKLGTWQMGLLLDSDWKGAEWIAFEELPMNKRITPALKISGSRNPLPGRDVLPLLRRDFIIKKSVKKATLFICGLGHFEASLNGEKIGDHFLDPGWTDYDKEAMYIGFDITRQLRSGTNTIGVALGNGMYYIPGERYHKITTAFGYPKMICRIRLEYSDSTTEDIISDDKWKTAPNSITFSSIYGGEDSDARLEQHGWDTPGFDDRNWKSAIIVTAVPKLIAQVASPLKVMDTLTTKKIMHPNDSTWVYDLGQNASGIPSIHVKGLSGATIKIVPGEVLDNKGFVSQQGTGTPNYFTYILRGGDIESWQPKFSYFGFRYLQIIGGVPLKENNSQKLPVITSVSGLHTRNSAAEVGQFDCSSNLFNRTDTLIKWAIKSNMASLLTDCPHREKLGWLEEVHLMANSIRYNFDLTNLFLQEINNMKTAQWDNGMIPSIAPAYTQFGGAFGDSPEWGSSGVLIPWYIYQWYGNPDILVNSYDMIKRYVDYLHSKAQNNIIDYGLGDWYDIGPKKPGQSQLTPKAVTATAYYYYDLKILSMVAKIIGKTEDSEKYRLLSEEVKRSYNEGFFHPDTKQYATGSQTANAISVYMGLVAPGNKKAVVDNIVNDLRKNNNALTAGDIGYRYLLKVLADEGRSDVIFDMNNRSDVPGYGYQLAHGATSLTESWQAYPSSSNNHFMLGHLMEWFYNNLAGISQSESAAASQKIIIQPSPVGNVTFANAEWQSPYGRIYSSWKKNKDKFVLNVHIPVNTTATICLPTDKLSKVYLDDKQIEKIKSIPTNLVNGKVTAQLGSGIYQFIIKE